MGENQTQNPISFSPDEARQELENARAAKEADRVIREHMKLYVACEEMARITDSFLIPDFLELVHLMHQADIAAEVVAIEAENPLEPGAICSLGVKFRCGDQDAPCKIEFMADPHEGEFILTVRNPAEKVTEESWPYASVIPRNVRKLIVQFVEDHFPLVKYEPNFNSFDQFDLDLVGPFKVEMEDEGKVSEIASTATMEEAIKMGASFTKMFKDKPLHIVDSTGTVVC